MSDQLAAAAAAMGLPEGLVQRSADARAAETGASAEAILTEWAGGEAAPVATTPAQEAVEEAPTPVSEPVAAPEPVIAMPEAPAATAEPVPAGPYVPPVLVDSEDKPGVVLSAILGLFLIVVMVGLVGPAIPLDDPGARSSEIDFSSAAEDGKHVYSELGCASCHTQLVRPVVADVGLGPVTLNDTNQVLGTRRFGPDLSDIGSRMTSAQIENTVGGGGGHPSHSLSSADMGDLVAYLSESAQGDGS